MSDITVGAQLYTCRDFCKTIEGVAETFRKVSEIGYTAVQISGFGPVNPQAVADLAAKHGLTIAATHIKWDRLFDDTDAIIAEHKLWGCRHLATGGFPFEFTGSEADLDPFLEALPKVTEILVPEGMDYSYHNHNHEMVRVGGKTWLELLYEKAPAEHLKAEIDTYWIQAGGGDPAAYIRKYPGRQPLVHFKDMTVTVQREARFAPIGEGNLNWPAILDACREAGVQYALVEQDKCYGMDPFEALAISYRNLKAMGLS
jgi:sugar phosphate isomerase/epimerase